MIEQTITIVGVGGIGSWTAKMAARLGCSSLVLIDPDVVESHNFHNQDYDPALRRDVPLPKVEAMRQSIEGIAAWHREEGRLMEVITLQERVTANSVLRGIIIAAPDTAEARRDIFSAALANPAIPLYIEAGAAAHQGVVRVFVPHNPDHIRLYERLLDAYGEGGATACVDPYMGPQFAAIIGGWILRFQDGWQPRNMLEAIIDYRQEPSVVTELILPR